MHSNQQVTAGAALTPAMIEALLKDPASWLSRQQQTALEERFRLRKELIKQEYRLAHAKEMDDQVAEEEALQSLHEQAERARIQSLDEYYAEQHQLALKLEGIHLTSPDHFNVLLTRQADLAQSALLLSARHLELTNQIQDTQGELKGIQTELEVVTHDWTEAKTGVQQARGQINDKFNGKMTIDAGLPTEREVSVSVDVLPEAKRKKVADYREDAIDRLVEEFNNGSIKRKDGSVDEMRYGIIMAPVFIDVLAEQKVGRSVMHTNRYATTLLPFVINLAVIAQEYRRLNERREWLNREEARQLEKLADQMRKQKELLQEMVKVQAESLELRKRLAANSSSYSNAGLITKHGFLKEESGQREKQQTVLDKDQQAPSLEGNAPVVKNR